jgi:eukaryotic-like serine/threonine-protein kinase
VPQEVEALVMRCLYKRPEERFQSMDEVLEAIRRAAASVGLSGVFSGPHPVITSGFTTLPGPGSGPISGPQTGPLPSPGTTGASTVALDIAEEESAARPARRTLPRVLFGGSLLLGLGVAAVLALRSHAPQAAPAPKPSTVVAPGVKAPPVEPPRAAGPTPAAPVVAAPTAAAPPTVTHFFITSEPNGAKVTYEGRELGETPVDLPVPAGADGHASALLTFSLEGYQRVTRLAEGKGPVVPYDLKLQKLKKSGPRPTGHKASSGG